MNTSTTVPNILAEGQVYGVLSRMYLAPRDLSEWRELATALREALEVLDAQACLPIVDRMLDHLQRERDSVSLAKEYVRLFRGPVRPIVYPYESMHVDGEIMGEAAASVVDCYRQAEIAIAESFRDLPDHVAAEIGFLGYLCVMEAACGERGDIIGQTRFRQLKRSFLADHLCKWLPDLIDSVERNTDSPFYRELSALTREFVLTDYTHS